MIWYSDRVLVSCRRGFFKDESSYPRVNGFTDRHERLSSARGTVRGAVSTQLTSGAIDE